ncbi:MAG: type II toxin-antitoxin system VapC family toxin [Chloroflexi bacterium]|nr:MAG: type II toxin-antitoxin system VapC family toxin [Chloroflexota bacterium]
MILDASALIAIVLDEPEREILVAKINAADTIAVGAPTLVEAGIVLSARAGQDVSAVLMELLASADAIVIEFGQRHWREAVSAWGRFGKGRHPAGLNFGDCLTYATALVAGEALLAKGDDFTQTDIPLA